MKQFFSYTPWLTVLLVGMILVANQMTAFAAENSNLGRIGGMVWLDSNSNGIHEPQEQTLAAYPVYLQRTSSVTTSAMVAVAYTDVDGEFVFGNLETGSYRVFTEAGAYQLVELVDVEASTSLDLPVVVKHNLYLPLTVR